MEKEIQLAPILPRVSIICWYMNIYKYRWKLGYYGLKGHQPMGTVPKSSQHLGYQWIIRWGAHWVPQALGNSILSSWGFPIFPHGCKIYPLVPERIFWPIDLPICWGNNRWKRGSNGCPRHAMQRAQLKLPVDVYLLEIKHGNFAWIGI